MIEGIPHLLSLNAAANLRSLADSYELVWCSGWEEKAPAYLPAALGLPADIPHLSFEHNPGRGHGHWKLAAIDAYAGPDRPLVWVDDALDERCHAWARARPGPTLLVSTDPAVGFSDDQAATLRAWRLALRRDGVEPPKLAEAGEIGVGRAQR